MQLITLALVGLTVLVITALFSRRTGIAAPLMLLVLGIVASFLPWIPNIELTAETVLLGILPPLLYASGRNVPLMDLRRNLVPIFWLSVVMVIVPALVVGFAVHWAFSDISLPLAIALGAAVAPIDAVAATTIGKRLGLPDRIMVLLEGESLFNDAAALVTMRMAVAALAGGFSFPHAVGEFAWAVGGGLLIGLCAGWILGWLRGRLNDPVLVTTVTLASPWSAYIPAEELHSSGVIAVVVCAVLMAHMAPRTLSVDERAMVTSTWATVAYVLEHAVFLLMGMQVALLIPSASADAGLPRVWLMSALVLGILVLLRFLGVLVPVYLSHKGKNKAAAVGALLEHGPMPERAEARFRDRYGDDWEANSTKWLNRTRADIAYAQEEAISLQGGFVLGWAGMRGVVTLAAIQTIPVLAGGSLVHSRSTVVLVAFVVAVSSLLIFGGTLPLVIRKLGLTAPDVTERRQEQKLLMKDLLERVNTELGPLDEQTIDGKAIDPEVLERFKRRLVFLSSKSNTTAIQMERDSREVYWTLYSRYLEALRAALEEERAVGAYSHHSLHAAQQIIDRFEANTSVRR